MLNDFNGVDRVYIVCGYTDLRKAIDGLATLVQQQFELDPFANTLFLFCGRRRDRIKGSYWERDGFILLYNRLEDGACQWPRRGTEAKQITPQQYRRLMEGRAEYEGYQGQYRIIRQERMVRKFGFAKRHFFLQYFVYCKKK